MASKTIATRVREGMRPCELTLSGPRCSLRTRDNKRDAFWAGVWTGRDALCPQFVAVLLSCSGRAGAWRVDGDVRLVVYMPDIHR
jgi:hypothetical protein